MKIETTQTFVRNLKSLKKKHHNISKLREVLDLIVNRQHDELVRVYRDHQLQGNLKEFR